MKKLIVTLTLALMLTFIAVDTSYAAYVPESDVYIEITQEEAREYADLLGFENFPLGEETARLSFELQEATIGSVFTELGVDYYYIWLTIDGEPVLAVDPPKAYPYGGN
ncbi:8-amino-7-oxononanoate synthase [Salirhabdus salicampi]|uniref:8-amino-7-oxononanoate synthase n=1 Tax=Salirhabdus salicampi TaxID=476102 RepID=UPI0020C4547D|nr:8-amino-7-oxononanoate synthase [Salirhabdus salicampi]MCP8615743.1 8-amino-7-oxononanoate synthase [Salirhabdus salicampi]